MRLSSSDHLLLSLGAQSISVGGRSREDGGRGPEGGVQAACVHGGCSHTVGGGGGTHPAPATAAATRKHCLSPFLPPHRLPRVLAVNHYLHPISSLGHHSFFLVKP